MEEARNSQSMVIEEYFEPHRRAIAIKDREETLLTIDEYLLLANKPENTKYCYSTKIVEYCIIELEDCNAVILYVPSQERVELINYRVIIKRVLQDDLGETARKIREKCRREVAKVAELLQPPEWRERQ